MANPGLSSEEFDAAVLKALSEGPKYAPEIYFWIVENGAADHPLPDGVLAASIDRLLSGGLIEEFQRPGYITSPITGLTSFVSECYRLTPDGYAGLWLAEDLGLTRGEPLPA